MYFFYDGNIYVALIECTTNIYRKTMISKISTKPISQNLWENKFKNVQFDWSKIWQNLVQDIKEPRLMTLNWKIISNVYATKIFLHKIGKEANNLCTYCDKIEYIEHFFYGCNKIKKVWIEVDNILLLQYNVEKKITQVDVLFGYSHADQQKASIINKIISVGKVSISKFRYGKYPDLISLLHFELRIRNLLVE
jgi:hypothetical protein